MPIDRGGGRRGGPGYIARPGKRIGEPFGGGFGDDGRPFRSAPFSTHNASISGVTRDSSGNPLGNCVVHMFRTLDDLFLGQVNSDGSGNFQIYPVPNVGGPFYLVAYKAGGPDVAGTTLNTLTTA